MSNDFSRTQGEVAVMFLDTTCGKHEKDDALAAEYAKRAASAALYFLGREPEEDELPSRGRRGDEMEIGKAVTCVVCGLRKKPIGRSAPLETSNSLCDFECAGYDKGPHPGHLWPGETQEQYGY